MKYIFHGVSLQNRRQSNMDSLLLKSRRIKDKNAVLAVVCDGVGSLPKGAVASGTAVKMLNGWFDTVIETDYLGLKLRDAVLKINDSIVLKTKDLHINTASTLSALLIVEDFYYIVHIGDSRIYSFSEGNFTILTKDDITQEGKLAGYIGQKQNISLQYLEGSAADQTFLVCSDGFYKRMDTNFLLTKMKTRNKRMLEESISIVTQHVIDCGEKDNISLACVKIVN